MMMKATSSWVNLCVETENEMHWLWSLAGRFAFVMLHIDKEDGEWCL